MAYEKAKSALGEGKPKKHEKAKHVSIKRAANGGHIITHDDGSEHIAADDDALRDHMEQNYMQPNPGEAEADAGQGGIPEGQGAGAPQ